MSNEVENSSSKEKTDTSLDNDITAKMSDISTEIPINEEDIVTTGTDQPSLSGLQGRKNSIKDGIIPAKMIKSDPGLEPENACNKSVEKHEESTGEKDQQQINVSTVATVITTTSLSGSMVEKTLDGIKSEILTPVKNEPISSPPFLNLGDQDYLPAIPPQTTHTAFSGSRFFPVAGTENRFRTESIDSSKPAYLCNPCGIKFSSPGTLEAHQTFYCSHRPRKGGGESEGEDGRLLSVSSYEPEENSNGETPITEPICKVTKSGKQYRCTHCSYSADKKVSLNRHMRMHSVSPATSLTNDSDSGIQQSVDRYCQECDIRFSNLKTFRAHKQHYCSTRNVIKRATNSNSLSPTLPSDAVISPPLPTNLSNSSVHLQPFLALPTSPILVIPYSLVQSASVLSGPVVSGITSLNAVYILLPDGSLQMITQMVPTSQNHLPDVTSSTILQPTQIPNHGQLKENLMQKSSKFLSTISTAGPLDLRLRRDSMDTESTSTIDISEEDKENHQYDEQTDHEDIVCAPSIPVLLSASSTCSTPSPSPLSPNAQSAKLENRCNRSPNPKIISNHSLLKPIKRNVNGVIKNSKLEADDKKMLDSIGDSFNITNVLLAAATQNNITGAQNHMDTLKDIPFSPEMLPHLSSALAQLVGSSTKRPIPPPLSVTNIPLMVQDSTVPPELLNPSILPLLTSEMALRIAASNLSPGTPYVRQGTWKCEDCNIGFCKYENYIAHKKHYCSTRKVQESSTQSDENHKTSPIGSPSVKVVSSSPHPPAKENVSPPAAVPINATQIIKQPYIHIVCNLCGIKFTSMDNLTTHQAIYCTNRTAMQESEKSSLKCNKCKVLLPVDQLPIHQCSATTVINGGWKCPCCFIIFSTADAVQKHIQTHNGIKAFLCTICNYKGNTIRGMRTHIRVHFDKRNPDIMEENYITCILEENGALVNSVEDTLDKSVKSATSGDVVTCNGDSQDKVNHTTVLESGEEDDEYIEVEELPVANEEPSDDARARVNKSPDSQSSDFVADDGVSQNSSRKNVSKYCETCDITFNYVSTYVAHKRFYCTNTTEDAPSPASTPEAIIVPANTAAAAHIV